VTRGRKKKESARETLTKREHIQIHLQVWLLGRERDIADGVEDFGELRDLFMMTFNREPENRG